MNFINKRLSIFVILGLMVPESANCGEFIFGFNFIVGPRLGMMIGYRFSEEYTIELSGFGFEGNGVESINLKYYPSGNRTYLLCGVAREHEFINIFEKDGKLFPVKGAGESRIGVNTCIGQDIVFKDPTWRGLAEIGMFYGKTTYHKKRLLDERGEVVFEEGFPVFCSEDDEGKYRVLPNIGIGVIHNKNRK